MNYLAIHCHSIRLFFLALPLLDVSGPVTQKQKDYVFDIVLRQSFYLRSNPVSSDKQSAHNLFRTLVAFDGVPAGEVADWRVFLITGTFDT